MPKGSLLLFDTPAHGIEMLIVCESRQLACSFRIFYIYDQKFSISDEPSDLCSDDVFVGITIYSTHCVVSNSVS
jgi:hypothetical protein